MSKILILIFLGQIALCRLVMVQETFRHGARYPIYPMKNDMTDYAITEDKIGELTSQGKRMHYLLGQRIYEEYWQQLELGTTINNSQIYIKSTNVNRTIESAQSHLMGMLQNLPPLILSEEEAKRSQPAWSERQEIIPGPVYINNSNFHSIPIHTELAGANQLNPGDFLYNFAYSNCPTMEKWEKQNLVSQLGKNITSHPRIKAAMDLMATKFNFPNINLMYAADFVDNFYCSLHLLKAYNTEVFDSQYRTEYDMIRSVAYYLSAYGTDLAINSTISPYFSETLTNMRRIIRGTGDRRLIIYSAHDMTIANILNGLRMTSAKCVWECYLQNMTNSTCHGCVYEYPQFTSSIIFELHQDAQNYTVKLRYSGKYMNMPFCNNQTECTFEQFESFLKQTIRSSYMDDCGVPPVIKPQPIPEPQVPIGLLIPLIIVGTLLLMILVYELYRFWKKRKEDTLSAPYRPNVEQV